MTGGYGFRSLATASLGRRNRVRSPLRVMRGADLREALLNHCALRGSEHRHDVHAERLHLGAGRARSRRERLAE